MVGFSPLSAVSQVERSSSVISSAWSRWGLRACHSSGVSFGIYTSRTVRAANLRERCYAGRCAPFPASLYGTFPQVLQGGDFGERKSAKIPCPPVHEASDRLLRVDLMHR